MQFKQQYPIIKKHLTKGTKRRSGYLIDPKVRFLVAHDTGNSGSTASGNVAYYESTNNKEEASAHIFVDDKEIIECIPSIVSNPAEKAWHVRYQIPVDNQLYGYDANDAAIGVEYCFGGTIDAGKSYARYVWTLAYLCFLYGLKPDKDIVGHYRLDPGRKTDPESSLKLIGKNMAVLIADVAKEYNACLLGDEYMKLIKVSSSNRIYALDKNNKKHWIFNEETFLEGRDMGLWGDWADIANVASESYAEGRVIVLLKK